jgi:type 1 glutamine amidotransferase
MGVSRSARGKFRPMLTSSVVPRVATVLTPLLALITGIACVHRPAAPANPQSPESVLLFQKEVVTNAAPHRAWIKSIGDLNSDGLIDLVVCGEHGPLVWYESPLWTPHVVAPDAGSESGSATGDMDGDGDLDLVVGPIWYENVDRAAQWVAHSLPDTKIGTHDILVVDLNGDDRTDIVMRGETQSMIWVFLQDAQHGFTLFTMEPGVGRNGLDVADLNADGRIDLVVGGVWMENPGGDLATNPWPKHVFGAWHDFATVRVADLDSDGRPDILLSVSEARGKVSWFRNPGPDSPAPWSEEIVAADLDHAHGTAIHDFDHDGQLDIAASEYEGPGRFFIYLRRPKAWIPTVIGTDALHNFLAADLERDGDIDFFGVNAWETKPAIVDRNVGTPPEKRVLVYSRTLGFRHDAIPIGIQTIQELGVANGFSVDATEDPSVFTTSGLARYRAVVFLNPSGDVLNAAKRAAFRGFIESGGGFVGVHNATAYVLEDWPWYTRLVGARYHSEIVTQPSVLRIVDHQHPSTVGLADPWATEVESYNFQPVSVDPGIRVLVSLDEASVKGGTMGATHPFSWYRFFDGGWSWYTTGGANVADYRSPAFRQHLLGGIRQASGI